MEGMESRDFLQVAQAKMRHSTLQAIASETDTYPNERETSNAAGMKMKATTRKATVVVYPVPVDFWCASTKATSSVVGRLRREESDLPT